MLTFAQMQRPVSNWKLDSVRDRRSLTSQYSYWDIQLIRDDGATVDGQHRELQMAWEAAVRAAESHEAHLIFNLVS